MIDKHKIVESFIKHFILKEKQERSLLELTNGKKRYLFINKLNHDWATRIDMQKMIKIPKNCNNYDFTKSNLKIKDTDLCYLISNYDDLDDQLMKFKQAFDKSCGRGLATLIITVNADKIYVETEQIKGSSEKFIGIA